MTKTLTPNHRGNGSGFGNGDSLGDGSGIDIGFNPLPPSFNL